MLDKRSKKLRLGDLLLENNLLTEESLNSALQEQNKTGGRLGKILVLMKLVEEDVLLTTLADQLHLPLVSLDAQSYDKQHVCSLDETLARRFRVVVLYKYATKVVLAMADPTDIFCLDEVSKHLSLPVDPVVAKESEILDLINLSYSGAVKIAHLAKEVDQDINEAILNIDEIVSTASDDEAPVAKLLLNIFEEAIRYRASDIHIEPDETVLRIRQRVDGVLLEQVLNEKRVANALVIKLKLMADLDIAEKRLPQDGRFTVTVHEKKVDVRISTMPINHGESVVLRLLQLDESVKNINDIGMPPYLLEPFKSVISKPNGLVLVTGPTGSGKTTSLYAALSELNKEDKKIITVEDPIEYRLPRVNQVQINEKIGLTFSNILRSALRQDPDILLIGEIRDKDSADIALRASMTGHLVFSTLHTNNAPSAALRLLDMGAEPFLVASAVTAIIAQRLVRRLCDHCKIATAPEQLQQYREWLTDLSQNDTYYQAVGCDHCSHTGYSGRTGIYELLIMDDKLQAALREHSLNEFMQLSQQSKYYIPLLDAAVSLAKTGVTSLDEIARHVV